MSDLVFGEPFGIKVGDTFPSRKALIKLGLHRSTMHGIDGNGNEGVAAIVLSGGYEDDVDFGDEIIYTGHGGNDPQTQEQIDHQSWEDHGNKGLLVSKNRGFAVRVIRGFKHNSPLSPKSGYRYAGLYKVVDAWEEIGKRGYIICRFRLIKEDTLLKTSTEKVKKGVLVQLEIAGKEPKWFSIDVDPPSGLRAQRISSTGEMARLLTDKTIGETIDFGQGFKILDIKRFMSS